MTGFCLFAALLGVVAGLTLRFIAAGLVFVLGLLIAAACYVVKGVPLLNLALAAFLSLVCMQAGYVLGLVLKATFSMRRSVSRSAALHDKAAAPHASAKPDA